MQYIENKTFDEINIGESAELVRTLRHQDIDLFSAMSGKVNPAHVDQDYAQSDAFQKVITHGMWGGSLISAVLGTELPGPGTIYVSQSLTFLRPVGLGETVTVRVTVTEKLPDGQRLRLRCQCINQNGENVIDGEAEVIAPPKKVRRPRVALSRGHVHEVGAHYKELIEATCDLAPIVTAVIHPCDETSLSGAVEAKSQGLITPVLVGPAAKIRAVAKAANISLDGIEIDDVPHSHAAAERAVALVRNGTAQAMMKGKLHTDEMMQPILNRETGLRTDRRMSHIFVLDVPHYPKPLFITDAAINIYPTLEEKRDIVQNAIDLAQALGIETPKVAILSAVETVYPKIASTVEAAALCKMADRGQITGGLLDGPLAFDNAISKSAAEIKGIKSEVAGDADILVVPDLEAGNMIAKQLIYLAGADAAGIVIGARVPIILTSRADGTMSRLASCAIAQLYAHHRRVP
ncbi:bifunctional enoyl-CoA hydratase/phosphate acetyltransferase [Pseudogemmobacter sp. W21_MBD1_M6]|uniref:bifunctional enoyl-CoA hydratase/phosphate acetyltransferase n=1 Tax=Pseudogemmobacter sp. W21_MBD1_M6 TaxID=3240271 RepID=UPI003F9DDD3C